MVVFCNYHGDTNLSGFMVMASVELIFKQVSYVSAAGL